MSKNSFVESAKKSVNISTFSSGVDILSAVINENLVHHEGTNITSMESVSTFVENLGSYALTVSDKLSDTERREVLKLFSMLVLKICTNV